MDFGGDLVELRSADSNELELLYRWLNEPSGTFRVGIQPSLPAVSTYFWIRQNKVVVLVQMQFALSFGI